MPWKSAYKEMAFFSLPELEREMSEHERHLKKSFDRRGGGLLFLKH